MIIVFNITKDRLWRMTRQPHGKCIGADANRNWGYHWNGNQTISINFTNNLTHWTIFYCFVHFSEGGASNSSCDETYAGPYPFSEPETKSLSEFITTIHENLVGYISFHSYSQLLLIPYGYNNSHVENYEELVSIILKII